MLSHTFDKELENFFVQFKSTQVKKKNVILQADENCSFVFYIKSGYVRVYRVSEQGEELTLIILKPGDFFPLVWKKDETINNYYLEAITPLEVIRIPQKQFFHFLDIHPEIFQELADNLLVRFGGLLTRIEYLVFGNAYRKVASTIFVCAKRFGKNFGQNIIVDLPLTHKDIANLVGITRETTCLEMKKLERKGLISHKGRLLVVSDMKKLEEESLLSSDQVPMLNNSL